ncbi:MAG: class I SAM-dependent methyltransferase [Rhodobiaceae bacterium]|nr:class I SAM-dependent methyltransferase [Rhodobiaceae bacterium]
MSELATISSAELRKLSQREFVTGLSEMSPSAIDRFKRMRKLSAEHTEALTTFLRQHPEKRLTAQNSKAPAAATRVKAKTKSSSSKPQSKPVAPKQAVDDDGYVQLWSRVRAWWDGEELAPSAAKTAAKKPRMQIDPADAAPVDPVADRLQIIQSIWGEGNSLPGGASMTLNLLDAAKPSADTLIADLSGGLGNGVRHMASTLDATVHGFERDKDLAAAANKVSEATDFAERATILPYDPRQLDKVLDKDRYNIIVAREFLCFLDDRKQALSVIGESLCPNGSFVFTDFVLANRATENKSVIEWRQAEPSKAYPATVDEYRELLLELRFDVKSMDDITGSYVSAIQTGWKAMVESLKSGSFSRTYVDTLMAEGQIWLARSRALESGQLRVVHGRAVMQRGPKRSLTDAMSID